MKKLPYIFLSLFLLSSVSLFAQYGFPYNENNKIDFKGKTLIAVVNLEDVLDKNTNVILDKVLKSEWSLCPYKVISKKEFESNPEEYKEGDKYCFLSILHKDLKKKEKADATIASREVAIGNKVKKNGVIDLSTCMAFSLTSIEAYSLEAGLVKDINMLKFFIENGAKAYDITSADKTVMSKVLLIPTIYIISTHEHFKNHYAYKYKVVEQNELSELLLTKRGGVAVLELTKSLIEPFITIYDPQSGRVLWHERASGDLAQLHNDLNNLDKSLKK